jgi:hypothetical protein
LEDLWEDVATSYNAENFAVQIRGISIETKLRSDDIRNLWEQLIAAQEAKDEDDDIAEPLLKLEQKLRKIALTGIQVGNLTKKHGKEEKEAKEGDVRKPVYVSWSKDGKPLYRAFSGKLARMQDIVWLPHATVDLAETAAKARWTEIWLSLKKHAASLWGEASGGVPQQRRYSGRNRTDVLLSTLS